MSTIPLQPNTFILYKDKPGRITNVSDKKIKIELVGEGTKSVRLKDVTALHPGPVKTLSLEPPEGEPLLAWELMAGDSCSLQEIAELAFDAYTPASVWAIWQMMADGLYFARLDFVQALVNAR